MQQIIDMVVELTIIAFPFSICFVIVNKIVDFVLRFILGKDVRL